MKYMNLFMHRRVLLLHLFLGATKIGEVWAMVCLSLMLVAYLMLKRYKIEALFLLSQCHYQVY